MQYQGCRRGVTAFNGNLDATAGSESAIPSGSLLEAGHQVPPATIASPTAVREESHLVTGCLAVALEQGQS